MANRFVIKFHAEAYKTKQWWEIIDTTTGEVIGTTVENSWAVQFAKHANEHPPVEKPKFAPGDKVKWNDPKYWACDGWRSGEIVEPQGAVCIVRAFDNNKNVEVWTRDLERNG